MLKETTILQVFMNKIFFFVGSMVDWIKRRAGDQHDLGSKFTRAILWWAWEKHFTALFPAWWSWQAVRNFNHISMKLKN